MIAPGAFAPYARDVTFVCGVFLAAIVSLRVLSVVLSKAATLEVAAEFGPLISKLGKIFIALVAVIMVLQHFQVDVSSLVVSLGVGSLAVGLAAQDTLANMFAGFTLLVDRPFRIGEKIRLASGDEGEVRAIGIRATQIRTADQMLLIVPNSLLVKERLLNLSRHDVS